MIAEANAASEAEGRASRLWLWALVLALLVLTVSLLSAYLWLERQSALRASRVLAERRVTALSERLTQSLKLASLVIAQTEARQSWAESSSDAKAWQADHAALLALQPLPFRITALDRDGLAQRLPGVTPSPAGGAAVAGERKSGDVGTVTWRAGLPLQMADRPVLPLVMLVSGPVGRPVAYAAEFDLVTLRQRLGAALEGADGSAALFRIEADGRTTVLARVPNNSAQTGTTTRSALSDALRLAPSGQFATVVQLDKVHRQVAYQRLADGAESLVMVFALSTDEVLARWHAQLPWVLGLAALVALVTLAGGRRLDRALVKLQQQRQAVARSEAQYRALTENMPDAMGRVDKEGRYLYVNPAVDQASGLPAGAFIGRTHAELGMPPDVVSQWQVVLARAFASGQLQRIEFSVPRGSGVRHWESLVVLEPSQPGQSPTALVISRDITERHETAQAAAEREQQLLEAQRIGRMGNFNLDLRTLNQSWSDELYRLYDAEPGSFQPTMAVVNALTHPDDRAAVQQALEQSLRQPGPVDFTHRVLLPSGRLKYLRVHGEVKFSSDGKALKSVGTVRDVTQETQSDQAIRAMAADLERRVQERTAELARSEARYRRIFEAVPVAIAEEDWSEVQGLLRAVRDSGVVDCAAYFADHPEMVQRCLRAVVLTRRNHATEALMARYRRPRDVAQLQGLELYYPKPEQLPLFVAELQALWDGRRTYSDRRRIPERNGQLLQLLLTVALPSLDDADGTALVCMTDVSELERVNAELDQTVLRLRQVNQELETFTYSVSHDLKAPLRGIDGYSRLLLTDHCSQLDGDGRDFLGHIRRATQHMAELIDDLLTYSRLERRDLTMASVPLAPLVKAVVADFQSELQRLQIGLELDIPQSLQVRADAQGLTIALRNLVDNALKFSQGRPTPRLVLCAGKAGGDVRLSVQDNGVGFDMKYHDRIFSIFQRLHRAEDYPGTGIGLAIVRKAMQRMYGKVWADSAPGQGAVFYIQLPAS